jgi:Chalcone isomerase-like
MHRNIAVAALVAFGVAGAAEAQTWTEPKSGIAFPVKRDDMTLLGGGLRVKKIVFTFKAYAIAFYVSDAALAGPLAAYKTASPEFYKELQTGDFKKEVVLRFMRNLSESRIQEAMRESLAGADPKVLDQFVSYFPELKEGQECVLRWAPGGTIETVMAGQAKPPIANRAFAEQLFGLYVGPAPIQDDIKAGVVARLGAITGAPTAVARETSGTVKSVQPNGFTIADVSGKDLFFAVDNETQIVARGASHRTRELRADGKPGTLADYLAEKQRVVVKYVDVGGKLTAREVQVR